MNKNMMMIIIIGTRYETLYIYNWDYFTVLQSPMKLSEENAWVAD